MIKKYLCFILLFTFFPDLTTTHTYNYPSGEYIAQGFTDGDDYKWYVCRLKDDFSVEWAYCAENEENNLYIADISKDGRILITTTITESDHYGSVILKELDQNGNVINNTKYYRSTNVRAAYFNDKIVVIAENLRVLNSDFTVSGEFDELRLHYAFK